MSKILNWTFGACFRTLGRFLAIFLVGVLLIFIGSKIGIELPDWLALRVNAETIAGWGVNFDNGGSGYWYDCSGSTTCTTQKSLTMLTDDYANRSYLVGDSSVTIATNGTAMVYRYPIVKDQLYNVQIAFCNNKSITNIMYTQRNFSLYPGDLANPGVSYSKKNLYTDFYLLDTYPYSPDRQVGTQCFMVTSYFVSSQDTTAVVLRLKNSGTNITGYTPSLLGYKITTLGLYSEALEEIIDNSGIASAESVEEVQQSVTQVQQEIKQTQDTITNDDTSGAQGSADGFFNDFKSEDFGLSSIVTAPLRGINAMLTDTCIAPSATYKGQTFSLPCGSMLWSRPGGEDFKSFLNVMYGGFLAYLVIRKFFLDVETLKNPNSDKVEVDKL